MCVCACVCICIFYNERAVFIWSALSKVWRLPGSFQCSTTVLLPPPSLSSWRYHCLLLCLKFFLEKLFYSKIFEEHNHTTKRWANGKPSLQAGGMENPSWLWSHTSLSGNTKTASSYLTMGMLLNCSSWVFFYKIFLGILWGLSDIFYILLLMGW